MKESIALCKEDRWLVLLELLELQASSKSFKKDQVREGRPRVPDQLPQFSDWLMVTNPEGPEGLGLRARDLQVLNFFHLVAGFR